MLTSRVSPLGNPSQYTGTSNAVHHLRARGMLSCPHAHHSDGYNPEVGRKPSDCCAKLLYHGLSRHLSGRVDRAIPTAGYRGHAHWCLPVRPPGIRGAHHAASGLTLEVARDALMPYGQCRQIYLLDHPLIPIPGSTDLKFVKQRYGTILSVLQILMAIGKVKP